MALTDMLAVLQQNVQNVWWQAGIILAVFIILALLVIFIVDRVAKRISKKTKTKLDDIIIAQSRKPLFFLVLVIGLQSAVTPLGLSEVWVKIIKSFSAVLIMYIVGAGASILLHAWGAKFAAKIKKKITSTILPLALRSLNIVFFVIAILWVLNIWQVNITPYLAGLGIGGIVLGLALQDTLKNIFGGVSMILDKNFHINDKVKLETGELGTILDIGLRSTKLRTYDNELVYIPNGALANMRITNYVRPDTKMRVTVAFGVDYGSDVEKVKKVVLTAIKKIKDVSSDPYMDAIFYEMGDSALLFKARFFVDDYGIAYEKKIEATQAIYEALTKAKIGIPYPQMDVHLKK